jgi:hypothetical protein
MNEPCFRDYHLLLDGQADVGATARLAERTEPGGSKYPQRLETMTRIVVPATGEACTTKVQFSGNYPLVQFFRFAIATLLVSSIEISIGAPP